MSKETSKQPQITQVLDGKLVAEALRNSLIPRVQAVKARRGRAPHLTVIMVGDHKASEVYVRNKHTACEKVGITSNTVQLPTHTTQAELETEIAQLNIDPNVDGVLVQLPLPSHLNSNRILEVLAPSKDADGLTFVSGGRLWAGLPLVKSCTPWGVMKILEHYKIPLKGTNAVVVGRSNIVGKPMAAMLLEAGATVTVCHSQTKDVRSFTSKADIVVVAAGRPRFMGREDFAKDSVVIDVGIHGHTSGVVIPNNAKLCGDVRSEELDNYVRAYTPVPGGVGPMTIACLLENTVILAEASLT